MRFTCILAAFLVAAAAAASMVGAAPLPNECPDRNAEWSDCGTACPAVCGRPPRVCKTQCVEGCFCREGFRLEYFLLASGEKVGKCVAECTCPPGQVYHVGDQACAPQIKNQDSGIITTTVTTTTTGKCTAGLGDCDTCGILNLQCLKCKNEQLLRNGVCITKEACAKHGGVSEGKGKRGRVCNGGFFFDFARKQEEKDWRMWGTHTCQDMQDGWEVCTTESDNNHGLVMENCPVTCAVARAQPGIITGKCTAGLGNCDTCDILNLKLQCTKCKNEQLLSNGVCITKKACAKHGGVSQGIGTRGRICKHDRSGEDKQPGNNRCLDSTWIYKGKSKKDCSWVGKNHEKRCKKKDLDGKRAVDECKAACGTCPGRQ